LATPFSSSPSIDKSCLSDQCGIVLALRRARGIAFRPDQALSA
jgi:hypothetical protein